MSGRRIYPQPPPAVEPRKYRGNHPPRVGETPAEWSKRVFRPYPPMPRLPRRGISPYERVPTVEELEAELRTPVSPGPEPDMLANVVDAFRDMWERLYGRRFCP